MDTHNQNSWKMHLDLCNHIHKKLTDAIDAWEVKEMKRLDTPPSPLADLERAFNGM